MWQRGLLNLICFEREIHRDCLLLWNSDVFFFWIHRNQIFLLNLDVSGMYGFWTIHRKCHHLGPFRCIVTLVSVGDTSGWKLLCPSRCTEVQIYLQYTSGWANTGHFRCIALKCQNKIHRNSVIHNHPDVSKSSIHRKSRFSSNPDVFHINFPRFYLSALAAYSRASRQKQTKYIGIRQFILIPMHSN